MDRHSSKLSARHKPKSLSSSKKSNMQAVATPNRASSPQSPEGGVSAARSKYRKHTLRQRQPAPHRCHVNPADPQSRYELQAVIHDSIFGKVFKGIDLLTGQNVAVKLSNIELIQRRTAVSGRPVLENPLVEAQVMKKLSLPLDQQVGSDNNNDAAAEGHGENDFSWLPKKDKSHNNHNNNNNSELGAEAGTRFIVPLLAEYNDAVVHWMVMPLLSGGELFDIVRDLPRPSQSYVNRRLRQVQLATSAAALSSPRGRRAITDEQTGEKLNDASQAAALRAKLSTSNDFALTRAQLRGYFRQMASALAFIHSQNLCHMDFSLENILLDNDGTIRVTDFGVALDLPAVSGELLPAFKHEKPGKLRYMAPEVLAGTDFDGRKADCFGLGVTLFCMLTGHSPFEMPALSDPCYAMIAQGKLGQLLVHLGLDHVVSDEAFEVLKGLLNPDFEQRMSIDDVLKSAYVVDQQPEPEFELPRASLL